MRKVEILAAGNVAENLKTTNDDDSYLFEVIDGWLKDRRDGVEPDTEAAFRNRPALAQELRRLWATAQVADVIGQSSIHNANTVDSATQTALSNLPGLAPARIVGDYELLEEVGRGGMGVVFRARQISLGRIVAMKMVLRKDLASAADLARFRAEAESAAQLDHPNIVPVYEVSEWDGQPFFSMKFTGGGSLAERLHAGPLQARDAAEILLPICRAVAAAHRHGLLHRDVKPSNILFDESGRPLLCDFGLAKRVETDSGLTNTGMILGTPSYMPPEQAAGNRGTLSAASDVYSLGAVLYHMLTGRPPFQAPSPVDTVLMVLEQEPLPPRLLNPRADQDLEVIALKCLEKSAQARYCSAEELAGDLEAFLAGEPILARATTVRYWMSRMLRDTSNAPVLQNWGLLWMLHSVVVLTLCMLTSWLQYKGVSHRFPYAGLWIIGLGAWAGLFWQLRRRGGPITFVERQIAHIWGASMLASSLLFAIEMLLGLPVLTLSPVLALFAGGVFLVKAAILSGAFYIPALVSFLSCIPMAIFPSIGLLIFGLVNWAGFFFPGLKYFRQSRATKPD